MTRKFFLQRMFEFINSYEGKYFISGTNTDNKFLLDVQFLHNETCSENYNLLQVNMIYLSFHTVP
jgi:hypothetical protein